MKNHWWLYLGFCVALSGQALAQMVVYDNLASGNFSVYPSADAALAPGGAATDEIGDDVTLVPNSPRNVTSFTAQFGSHGTLSGDEQVRIRFYLNDGPTSLQGGAATPGTVVYDSGALPLSFSNGQALVTLNNINVTVPDSFTWSATISGLTGSETAGLAIHAPTTGQSFDEFWQKIGGAWDVYSITQPSHQSGSFGAQFTAGFASAVPEPAATPYVCCVVALATAVALRRGRPGNALAKRSRM